MTEELPTFDRIQVEPQPRVEVEPLQPPEDSLASWSSASWQAAVWSFGVLTAGASGAWLLGATGLWGSLSHMVEGWSIAGLFLLAYVPAYVSVIAGTIFAGTGIEERVSSRPLWPFVVLGAPLSLVIAGLAAAVGLMAVLVTVGLPYRFASAVLPSSPLGQGLLFMTLSWGGAFATGLVGFRYSCRVWHRALLARVILGMSIAMVPYLLGFPPLDVQGGLLEEPIEVLVTVLMVAGLTCTAGMAWLLRLRPTGKIAGTRGRAVGVILALALSASFLSGGAVFLAALLL